MKISGNQMREIVSSESLFFNKITSASALTRTYAKECSRPIRLGIQGAMQILQTVRKFGKLGVVARDEVFEKRIPGLHVRNVGQPQFPHQPILQRPVGALDAPFGLA